LILSNLFFLCSVDPIQARNFFSHDATGCRGYLMQEETNAENLYNLHDWKPNNDKEAKPMTQPLCH
jgi:hypothetical protein